MYAKLNIIFKEWMLMNYHAHIVSVVIANRCFKFLEIFTSIFFVKKIVLP
jgi:hypothetical protein